MLFGLFFGFSGFELIIGAVVVFALLKIFVPAKAISRMRDSIRAQFGAAGRFIIKQDPVAVMQQSIDDAEEELRISAKALEENGKMKRDVQNQVARLQKEIAIVHTRLTNAMSSGRNEEALKHQVQKQRLEKNLVHFNNQLEQATAMYDNIKSRILLAQNKIKEIQANAGNLQAQLNMSRVMKSTAELNANMKDNFASLTSVSESQDLIQQEINANLARVDAIQDLNLDGGCDLAAEEEAEIASAKAALEELKKSKSV